MEGQIKVTAQELLNASSDFEARNSSVNDITAQMLSLARNLSSQWEGEAATAYINKFNELEDDMQLISKKITEHVTDLQEMASIYENAEKLAQESGSGLNAQLIS
ncbi:MAG: WXG100 family type VII secretion target [Sarcina sp.]|uniref:WXG100 family type VII secretion target n=1 Tax=Sarcina sp. DSM 11001 TaxID=1798184 RepID=UPI0008924501|nr:WXG100 family type VII secretion target [Sarcina sp. DSM 11001]MBE6000781.1 WXG100 family type VII secretion target [Sarcina sp.]SDK37662.1 WXG100 family type VII secretion target [Sarcina sp. DSM 11001]